LQAAAAALGQRLLILQASTLGQLQDAFATMKQQQVRALIVSSDPFFFSERVKLVVLMARDACRRSSPIASRRKPVAS
jgi:hypothetical protein